MYNVKFPSYSSIEMVSLETNKASIFLSHEFQTDYKNGVFSVSDSQSRTERISVPPLSSLNILTREVTLFMNVQLYCSLSTFKDSSYNLK